MRASFASRRPIRGFALCATLAVLCGATSPRTAGADPDVDDEADSPAWEYRVAVSTGLRSLRVDACLHGFRPKRLVLGDDGGTPFVSLVAPAGGEPGWRHTEEGWLPTETGPQEADCVSYEVDLARMAEGRHATRVGRDLLVDVGLWLLRPGLVPRGTRATATFTLPPGLRVAVPWRRMASTGTPDGGAGHPEAASETYALDETAFQFLGPSAFGRFQPDAAEVAGSTVELVVLDGTTKATAVGIRRWVDDAVKAVAGLYGGAFPPPHAEVLVRPVRGDARDPVPFGRAMQGGGASLSLLLADGANDDALPGEWVAVHEFTHLCMPVIALDDAWFSEGFVTYYQDVLRARAGYLTALDAWQRIESGFGRGRRTGGVKALADESRTMGQTHAFYRVYWAGAAIALLADVEIRRSSGGSQSLDDVMRHLAARRGNPVCSCTAAAAMAEVDAWLGRPVLAPIAEPMLRSNRFPDVSEAYRWLGIVVKDEYVSATDAAPGAAARSAIMSAGGAARPAEPIAPPAK